ncbi:putative aspartic peptidase A1 family, aspartic peptidase domain superfamily, xylanase inhibitor [Helianthus annuus]|nr:putative aspartic peptidase A1 family, aspartic peptidase domain superfamily, xylanase inhibitor [Helianthus annuus]
MLHLFQLFLLLLALIPREAIAQYPPPYTSFFAPLHKHTDAVNPLYSVQIMTAYVNMQFVHSYFLIDIDAPVTWHDCIVQWNMYPGSCPNNTLCTSPVSCDEYQCTEVQTSYSYKSPYCPQVKDTTPSPEGYCTCSINVMNPINWPCSQALLNYDNFFVNTSNGRNPLPGFYAAFSNAACAPSSAFESFPVNVTGVMALSLSPSAFLVSLDQPPLKRTFSLCLPSTSSAPGILFYGNGPFHLLPQSNIDVKNFLAYTPLLKHPDSFGYFIGVNSIVIKTRSIDIPGNTTAKLSTIEPYTTLRTDIYNRVVMRFSMVTKRFPLANPIAPFDLCFSTFTNGTKVDLKVPDIDFNLPDGKKWAVSTANSMKQITSDVACLAFVDGGATSEHAIVIGTYQFEDNFLLFDLENSIFGFSSSLLRKKTSCANFNFTMGSG